MDSFSVLVGGKAGDGIAEAGRMIAYLLNRLGYRLYEHIDSPSLIRGGHTFVIIRAHGRRIGAHQDRVNVLIALDSTTVEAHSWRLKGDHVTLYDADSVTAESLPPDTAGHRAGVALRSVLADLGAPTVMRNAAVLGALCRTLGIPWLLLEDVVRRHQPKQTDLNVMVARRGYDAVGERLKVHPVEGASLPIVTGLQAAGLGLLSGGLKAYVGYPMTPSSGLLHFLAEQALRFELKVYQPEGEIAAILMALGHAAAGERVAVGTSGGGFALMAEGLSLAGQAELPLVVMLGQRTGPSTGLPTYTGQSDLHFAMHAGHGEFPRAVIAPGDAEQMFAWSRLALDLSWKYQLPVIVLGDRTLNDNSQSYDETSVPALPRLSHSAWDERPMAAEVGRAYLRYLLREDGISPFAPFGRSGAIVKVNSYTHDEWGLTTEDPLLTAQMQEKLLHKDRAMADELARLSLVNVYGDPRSSRAIVTWGSPTGALREIGELAGVRVVQPVVLRPFPVRQLADALVACDRVAVAEMNATGQLATLMEQHGLPVHTRLSRYNGRPWAVGELRQHVEEALA
ncbi:MAG: 2-oxoacid:acceptor oxidoreductase family protein [Thermoleophilia bacterium]